MINREMAYAITASIMADVVDIVAILDLKLDASTYLPLKLTVSIVLGCVILL